VAWTINALLRDCRNHRWHIRVYHENTQADLHLQDSEVRRNKALCRGSIGPTTIRRSLRACADRLSPPRAWSDAPRPRYGAQTARRGLGCCRLQRRCCSRSGCTANKLNIGCNSRKRMVSTFSHSSQCFASHAVAVAQQLLVQRPSRWTASSSQITLANRFKFDKSPARLRNSCCNEA
jgi:hypothetical protein